MEKLRVPQINDKNSFFNLSPDELTFPMQTIGNVNWPGSYPYKPDVKFIMAHNNREIFLRFFVEEQSVLALTTEDNGEVWTDSCAEFFISLDDTGYYNFEFNCIGTMLLGFRKEKDRCIHADQQLLDTIGRKSSLGTDAFPEKKGKQYWNLCVTIPISSFFQHSIQSLSGLKAKGNFYKCGDNLSVPYFLSWSPIDHPTPNFHLENFFGEIQFE